MSMISGRGILAATLLLGTTVVAATPAAAVVQTFATFSPVTSAKNYRFVNLGNAGARTADANVYTTSTATANTPGAAAVRFSFLIPALAPFVTDISALYTMTGTIAKNSPVSATGDIVQAGLSGSFSFLTTSAITVSGPGFITHTYAAGSNLLSGVFSNGSIVGTIGSTSGSSFASGVSGTTIAFTSDFLDFSDVVSLDRATTLTAINPKLSKHAGPNGALSGFRAVTGGQFSSDPVPLVNFLAVVPEPSSWAMMVMGFGLVGFAARRRTGAVAA